MLKVGLILVFSGKIKIGLVFGFCGCHFIGIGLVSVCHFTENGISTPDTAILERTRSGSHRAGDSWPDGDEQPGAQCRGREIIRKHAYLDINVFKLFFIDFGNMLYKYGHERMRVVKSVSPPPPPPPPPPPRSVRERRKSVWSQP